MSGFLSGRTSLTTVQTADIADDAITEAKVATDAIGITELKAGTDGNLISYDTSGDPVAVATGSDGQVLTSSGAGAVCAFETLSAGFTQATAQATTSGTLVTFSSIPAGVKVIHISFMGVSSTSGGHGSVQIGDAGGIETSGYNGTSAIEFGSVDVHGPHTDNWEVYRYQAADTLNGHMTMVLGDASNTWTQTHICGDSSADRMFWGGGIKSLSGELTQLTVGCTGSTLDAGSVNIVYI